MPTKPRLLSVRTRRSNRLPSVRQSRKEIIGLAGPFKVFADTATPGSMVELHAWVHKRLHLQQDDERALLDACKAVVNKQRHSSRHLHARAIRNSSNDLRAKVDALQNELSIKSEAFADIAAHFAGRLARLTDHSHHDPKTKLLQFPWFMDRLESFLEHEQRLRWCAVGLVDIANFKSYNDTLGHLAGDRIIERVARILAEQIRSDDLLAGSTPSSDGRSHLDLHARLGGDEFTFLIPDVLSFVEACRIAQRFKHVVEHYEWASVNPKLQARPVIVDIGMACLHLGPLAERQPHARQLATKLVDLADQMMYSAKRRRADTVHSIGLRVGGDGTLIRLVAWEGAFDNSLRHCPRD